MDPLRGYSEVGPRPNLAPPRWYRLTGMDGGPDPIRLLEDLLAGDPFDTAGTSSDWAA